MQASISLDKGTTTVIVVGEIDVGVVHDLAGTIDDALGKAPSTLVIDLSAVTFCDSSGLGQFLHTERECKNRGITFRIVGTGASVRTVFELTDTTYLLSD